eukprot:2392432-Prymnesium_polylepis.2
MQARKSTSRSARRPHCSRNSKRRTRSAQQRCPMRPGAGRTRTRRVRHELRLRSAHPCCAAIPARRDPAVGDGAS